MFGPLDLHGDGGNTFRLACGDGERYSYPERDADQPNERAGIVPPHGQ